jgi:hypothetical protein
VTLSINEALESLKINLAGFMKPPGILLPTLADIQIKPKSLPSCTFLSKFKETKSFIRSSSSEPPEMCSTMPGTYNTP